MHGHVFVMSSSAYFIRKFKTGELICIPFDLFFEKLLHSFAHLHHFLTGKDSPKDFTDCVIEEKNDLCINETVLL